MMKKIVSIFCCSAVISLNAQKEETVKSQIKDIYRQGIDSGKKLRLVESSY
jgi:hypothetical protein